MRGSTGRWVAAALWLALLPGCRSQDPACAGLNAASVAPSDARYRAMRPAERAEEARRFNALAARCGWEP